MNDHQKTIIRGVVQLSADLSLDLLKCELPEMAECELIEENIYEIIIRISEDGAGNVADGDLKDYLLENYQDLVKLKRFHGCAWELYVAVGSDQPQCFDLNQDLLVILAILQFEMHISSVS